MVEFFYGVEHERKHEKISLSNYTVHCRSSDMSQNILNQVAHKIRNIEARISLQLIESIEVSNCAYLLVNWRYVHAVVFKQELLMRKIKKRLPKRLMF